MDFDTRVAEGIGPCPVISSRRGPAMLLGLGSQVVDTQVYVFIFVQNILAA